MPVAAEHRTIVEQVFQAMHARAEGEKQMMSLFAQNAVLTEPFSGQSRTHSGRDAIRDWFREAMNQMPPEMTIKMDQIDMAGDQVRADWTCNAPFFEFPMKGYDLYTIRNGKIEKADYVVTQSPPMPG